jgi:hypothetical protein
VLCEEEILRFAVCGGESEESGIANLIYKENDTRLAKEKW